MLSIFIQSPPYAHTEIDMINDFKEIVDFNEIEKKLLNLILLF